MFFGTYWFFEILFPADFADFGRIIDFGSALISGISGKILKFHVNYSYLHALIITKQISWNHSMCYYNLAGIRITF